MESETPTEEVEEVEEVRCQTCTNTFQMEVSKIDDPIICRECEKWFEYGAELLEAGVSFLS